MKKLITSFPNKKLREADSIFLKDEKRSFSFKDFHQNVNSHAEYLKSKNVRTGSRVVIISENSTEFIALIFALWKLKAIPVPINIRLSAEEIKEIIKFIHPKIAFADKKNRNLLSGSNINFENLPATNQNHSENSHLKLNFNPQQTAVIIFTSGSSGKPKGVEITFNNLIQSAKIGNKVLSHRPYDNWLASLPFYHIGGFSIITRAYIYGTKLTIPKSISVNDTINSLNSNKITHVSFVSAHLKTIVDKKIKSDKKLRVALLGGGFSDSSITDKAIKLGWKIYKVYGSSEVTSFAAIMKYGKKRKEASGKAISPSKIFIKKDGKSLDNFNSGEIVVKSPIVFKKYFNNPTETKKKLKNNSLYTGDIGYLDSAGFLFVEARRSDLIVTGGENVNPNQIEKELLKFPKIIEASVFPLKDEKWGQIIAAAIITKKNLKLKEDEIKTFLRKSLADYKIPKKIFFLNELPKNSLGKIQKEKLTIILSSPNI